jgi:hypothetical protein
MQDSNIKITNNKNSINNNHSWFQKISKLYSAVLDNVLWDVAKWKKGLQNINNILQSLVINGMWFQVLWQKLSTVW